MTEDKKTRPPMSEEELREFNKALLEAMPLLSVIIASECPRCLGSEDDPFFNGPEGEALPCFRCRGTGCICPVCRKSLKLTIEGTTLVGSECDCNKAK